MEKKFDFSGWATRNDLLCGDGRTIRHNAFKDCDGLEVPLIWNHDHDNPDAVLGKALLEHRDEGVYAYCTFNDTENGKLAKELVQHGDVKSLSIWANKLKQIGRDVFHGKIRELSLVLAGANPGAYIDSVMAHSDDGNEEEELIANYDERTLIIYHSDENEKEEDMVKTSLSHADDDKKTEGGKTVKEVLETLNEEQKTAVYALVGEVAEQALADDDDDESDEEGEEDMKHNLFDQEEVRSGRVLSHSDEEAIINLAKTSSVGNLQRAISEYVGNDESLAHGIEDIEVLFPEYKTLGPAAPELLERDQSWVGTVMNGVHKSPISRIRTRYAEARIAELRAKGYQNKGDEKTLSANIKVLSRTTDPQTVYRKDAMHRDDIVDITDFNVVEYIRGIMKRNLTEEIAQAILIGDGREDGDADKIHEDHIRSIWNDDEMYTIHKDVDIEAARTELQGTNTAANFGDNYVYAEAIITAALYAREQYKGTGSPVLFCTPHLVNVMLLARDLNGRRIYSSKADLTAALNVSAIHTIEQFEGKTRTDADGNTKKLLGIMVNLADYQVGSTKGGEITNFEQFDIDFNQHKYLMETRLSGALTKVYSAIALEEPVAADDSSAEG